MSKKREISPGSVYHIMHRTNHREPKFKEREALQLFVLMLNKAHEKYEFHVLAYSVMPNHVHLLLQPYGEDINNLSRICSWLFAGFARVYNKRCCKTGHFWENRYRSKIVDNDHYLSNVLPYVLENPVRAELVENPVDYEYSTLGKLIKCRKSGNPYPLFDELPEHWRIALNGLMEEYLAIRRARKHLILRQNNEQIALSRNEVLSFQTQKRFRKKIVIRKTKSESIRVYDQVLQGLSDSI